MGYWGWMTQDLSYELRGMCYSPPYGFQLLKGNTIVVETSICWHCNNFYVTDLRGSSWYGFDTNKQISQALLKYCDSLLPYPKKKHTEAEQDDERQRI